MRVTGEPWADQKCRYARKMRDRLAKHEKYLTKRLIERSRARGKRSGPVFGRRRIEPRMILKKECRRGVSRRDRFCGRLGNKDRRRN